MPNLQDLALDAPSNRVSVPSVPTSVVDADGDAQHSDVHVPLDFEQWLPYAAQVYQISRNIQDYVLVTTLVCPSDLPNRNGYGFPLSELLRFRAPPYNRQMFRSWVGCPTHLEHRNKIHAEAKGVILDTELRRITGHGDDRFFKVMGLLAFDKTKDPDLCDAILKRRINTYSMGADAEYFTCSYCHKRLGLCPHCNPKAEYDMHSLLDPITQEETLVFRNAHNLSGIETSAVVDPAWAPALSDRVYTFADLLQA